MRKLYLLILCSLAVACSDTTTEPAPDYAETPIADLHDQMQRGELTSEQLVSWYLERIATLDSAGPELNSIIELNPDALSIAQALDQEWQESGPRGPMHGIPVVLKANIDTGDKMHTARRAGTVKIHLSDRGVRDGRTHEMGK